MRVISGSAKGRKLISPEGQRVRPTLDRVKESIFNMLSVGIYDSCVLDLFAGSGALGIEALSRGAKKAVFVDVSSDSLKIIRQNIELTHFEDKSDCFLRDFITYLNETTEKFDYIFLDPPYAADFLTPALSLIHKNKILNKDGIVVCELDSSDSYSAADGFDIYRDKKYGKARILLMKEL